MAVILFKPINWCKQLTGARAQREYTCLPINVRNREPIVSPN